GSFHVLSRAFRSYLNFPNPFVSYPLPKNNYPFIDSYYWNDAVPPHGDSYHVDQFSPCGFNIYGGFQINQAVAARADADGDGIFDTGGCAALDGLKLTVQGNYMSVAKTSRL
ncbi:MAG: hypothetical protein WKF30_19040, partial [Pyrinomonadaceae bacterium]